MTRAKISRNGTADSLCSQVQRSGTSWGPRCGKGGPLLAVAFSVLSSGKGVDSLAEIMHLEDIITTNGFGIHADTGSPGGLFPNASRINHSCIPNADQASFDNDGYKVMRANRDIETGEEITTSYIAHFLPRELRQLLLGRWGFACQCPACDPSHPFSHPHERFLKDHHQLCQDSCMGNTGRLKAGGAWSYAVLEQAAKRAQKRIELLAKHHALRKFSRQAYLGAFDIALAQYKMRRLRSKLGDAIKLLELVIEADRIYYGDTSAVTQEHEGLYNRLQGGDIPGV
ncbi:hypothetical protein GGTG_12521 [Gaeumannomyces tritici R3-111a-1]|uniref:SET domain-containing protein n=1 Tax=Gaeumannomyces tritici (strain R3-111a-1) TaxID=644352 RepID=J3PG97_GAET3|nr:hypothetical protein GGTG_12521 [Gaeumannomyces tritici R3-111a-1]EJT69637.1 hypothetical protein GGTG_12521 [Gaeumannomyces tritici R3-111a-1]